MRSVRMQFHDPACVELPVAVGACRLAMGGRVELIPFAMVANVERGDHLVPDDQFERNAVRQIDGHRMQPQMLSHQSVQ